MGSAIARKASAKVIAFSSGRTDAISTPFFGARWRPGDQAASSCVVRGSSRAASSESFRKRCWCRREHRRQRRQDERGERPHHDDDEDHHEHEQPRRQAAHQQGGLAQAGGVDQGQLDEVVAGCDLILEMDDRFEPVLSEAVANIVKKQADVGIVGENIFVEKQKSTQLVKRLDFAKCRLSIAVPRSESYGGVKTLQGKNIATSYPKAVLYVGA